MNKTISKYSFGLLSILLLVLSPIPLVAIERIEINKSGKKDWEKSFEKVKLDCEKYGEESCTARFLAMAGCTYAMGLKSDKTPIEAMEHGDKLFAAMMRGHQFDVNNMFDAQKNLKTNIKQETIERLYLCKSIIEEATAKVYKKKHGSEISPEDQVLMARAFPWWYVDEFEKLAK
tara:strand:- start:139 stop:663 length:525 start_codon:yes stop_codon:yes gene_type:complete